MQARLKGPLTIDGIALGQTRAQVDSTLGRATTNANPAWARYYAQSLPEPGAQPLLVSFRPAWPKDAHSWRVDGLHGTVLRRGDTLLVKVGDTCAEVGVRLGTPEEVFSREPGFGCMIYESCVITYDELSFKVVEICLQTPVRPASPAVQSSNAPDKDAVAC